MASFQFTSKAKSDLVGIARYTERTWGREQRNRYLEQLDACFNALFQNSEIGVACEYIRKGYRKCLQGKHMIFYRIRAGGAVEIIRVLHQNMDVSQNI